jgi:hypothetical protein
VALLNAPDGKPCPALVWDAAGVSSCGFVVDLPRFAPDIAKAAREVGPQLTAALLGVDLTLADLGARDLGAIIRRTLGPGDCDSGPAGPWADAEVGLTAREWEDRGGRQASEAIVEGAMVAAGWEIVVDANGDRWTRPPPGG